MDKELSLLCKTMGEFTTQKIGDFEFFTGKIEGQDVTLLCSGMGKVNAAVGCTLLIQHFKSVCVINTGSAGGIRTDLKVGDAIISSGLIYHDADCTALDYAPGQIPNQPLIYSAEEKLVKLAEDAVDELKNDKVLPFSFNCCRGLIGTGDAFMHEPEKIEKLRQVFPDIVAVEMEGAAVAHCCRLFSIPALVIRSLSDVAGIEAPVDFEEFISVASEHSAQIVIRILKNIK